MGQQYFRVADGISDRVVLLLPSKGQLRESSLIAGCIFNVDEMLVVRDAVVFGQLKETDEGLEQRRPYTTHNPLTRLAISGMSFCENPSISKE